MEQPKQRQYYPAYQFYSSKGKFMCTNPNHSFSARFNSLIAKSLAATAMLLSISSAYAETCPASTEIQFDNGQYVARGGVWHSFEVDTTGGNTSPQPTLTEVKIVVTLWLSPDHIVTRATREFNYCKYSMVGATIFMKPQIVDPSMADATSSSGWTFQTVNQGNKSVITAKCTPINSERSCEFMLPAQPTGQSVSLNPFGNN